MSEAFDRLGELANSDPWLVHRGRSLSVTFLVEHGETQYLIRINRGRVEDVAKGPFVLPRWTFALRASAVAWATFWRPIPPPGHHDLIAMLKMRTLRIEGDQHPFMANLRYFKDLLAIPRGKTGSAHTSPKALPGFEPIVGRYLRLPIAGTSHRIYVEEAGEGVPLLCLHTAGSDSRQYRALFNDADILQRFRVIAFDLPWHGKSSPPAGWQNAEYKLTSRAYVDAIMALVDALALDRPVVIGCSIGGRVVLHLALEHARRFRALIGLESGAHSAAYYDLDWLHRSDVHGGEVCGGLVSGLIAPTAPDADKWETIWHYMQGGPGVFKGDLHYYTSQGDVRDRLALIDTGACPLYFLTGEYDYSCTPDDTRELARRIEGAHVTIMEGLGHFPVSEDPQRFLGYLRPVLARILEHDGTVADKT